MATSSALRRDCGRRALRSGQSAMFIVRLLLIELQQMHAGAAAQRRRAPRFPPPFDPLPLRAGAALFGFASSGFGFAATSPLSPDGAAFAPSAKRAATAASR